MKGHGDNNKSLIHNVSDISNRLDNLIPVGTIHYLDLPLKDFALHGIGLSGNGKDKNKKFAKTEWRWLDIPFMQSFFGAKMHPTVDDLAFLIKYRYAMGTYKIVKCTLAGECSGVFPICKVRLYAVPSDVSGSRFFSQWRQQMPKNLNLDKTFMNTWNRLVEYIDFSDKNWDSVGKVISLKDLTKEGILLIKATNSKEVKSTNGLSNFHVDRWSKNKPCLTKNSKMYQNNDLEQIVQRVYNNIESPRFVKNDSDEYRDKGDIEDTLDPRTILFKLMEETKRGCCKICGVLSKLYPFQVRSVCKMYERESFVHRALVPNYIQVGSPMSRKVYYFDLLTYRFLQTPELFVLPKGGILAENMGFGKTLICLSLICLTKFEVSRTPDDHILYNDSQEDEDDSYGFKTGSSVKSLTEICVRTINQKSLPWKYFSGNFSESIQHKLEKYPGYFKIATNVGNPESTYSLRHKRNLTRSTDPYENELKFRKLFLSSTTLVVVPDGLFHQWIQEIEKHTEKFYLTKLYISSHKKDDEQENPYQKYTSSFPDNISKLLKNDIIIISYNLFARQFDVHHVNSNPILRVYWKRLLIDEGHSVKSKNSRISLLCGKIYAERRWAVSGTPTFGLTNLPMEEEESSVGVEKSPKKKNKYVIRNTFNVKDDLHKLGTIVGNFLKIEPFCSQSKLWYSTIVKPLADQKYGCELSLSNLLNFIIVRHTLAAIDEDLTLPQLHHDAVFLLPSYHNKLSINLFTSVLAVNAVTSERRDIDYMFHPANRQQLRKLVTNLQRASFYWTGFQLEDIEFLIKICEQCLNRKKPNGEAYYENHEVYLLEASLETAKIALDNARWRTLSMLHEMTYYVSGLPLILEKEFATGSLKSNSERGVEKIGIFGAPQLVSLQDFFYRNRFLNPKDGLNIKVKVKAAAKEFWKSYWRDTAKRTSEKYIKQKDKQDTDLKKENYISKEKNPYFNISSIVNFRENSLSNLHSPHMSLHFEEEWTLHRKSEDLKFDDFGDVLDWHYLRLRNATIRGTASTKLSYLASRLLEHKKDGIKSVVFFEFEDNAYYLTEILDILAVNYILYATFIPVSQRTTNLTEFSNHSTKESSGISLIMDLKLAAHGLNIISATRFYFINPVWQPSVEAQAIKRSHRIGQTKDVYVETLVLKGTLEEEIYRRRFSKDKLDGLGTQSKTKYVIDDIGMQDYVLKHNFLPIGSEEEEYAPFVLSLENMNKNDSLSKFTPPEDEKLLDHKVICKPQGASLTKHWVVYLFNNENLIRRSNQSAHNNNKAYLPNPFPERALDKNSEKRKGSAYTLANSKKLRFN